MTTAVRSRMTQRARIERDAAATPNPYGHDGPPDWQPLGDPVPAFLYSRRASRISESATPERTVTVEEYALLLPIGADVTPSDRINGVEDRQGNAVLSGVFNIREVKRHHDHLEAVLEGAR